MQRVLIFLSLLLLVLTSSAQAANISVNSNRNPVRINDSFTLTFSAEGSIDDDPDFSPLEKDFDILVRSSGSQTTLINGSFSSTRTWTLNLMPKREGNITVPPIAFGSDQSPAMLLTVKAVDSHATSDQEVFIEMEASTDQAWVQSQIVLAVRLLSAIDITQAGLEQLTIPGLDTVVEQLGDNKQYRTQRGGRTYLVIERHYALFPQQAGILHIPAQMGEVAIPGGSSAFFDPFARNTQTRRIQSKALDIKVKPIPAKLKGQAWLPARQVQLSETWSPSPPDFQVGEPVTRTLTLRAEGLSAAQLPALQTAVPAGIKSYPDQPALEDDKRDDGIIGRHSEKLALIPTRHGRYTLPEIRIPWWNTRTSTLEIARIAPRTIQVPPGKAGNSPSTPPPAAEAPPVTSQQPPAPAGYWPWISLLLGVGWLITLLLWWAKSRTTPTRPSAPPTPSSHSLRSAVLKACGDNQAQACKEALIAWGRKRFPSVPINSLGDIAAQVDEPLHQQLLQLNTVLYGNTASPWRGEALAQAFSTIQPEVKPAKARKQARLAPLNPSIQA